MYKVTVPTVITNGHFNKEKTLAELKRCGADRVALALDRETEYTFSSPKNLKLLGELVEYYHENGLEVLVWLGETLGHDGAAPLDRYTNMRALDYDGGVKEIGACCPSDERFIADFCRWIQDVAKCGPDMIMLDDDFRLGSRAGVLFCCCCDRHLRRMSEIVGEEINVDTIKKISLKDDKGKYRDAWLTSQKEAMEGFAAALRKALDEINPKIRLSFCACTDVNGQEGWDVFRVARIMAGDTKPFLRTIGAPYWGSTVGETVEWERSQYGKMPDGEVFSEGDTYPRPRTAVPAALLECFDMMLRADGRPDGILKYMFDYVSDADYETGYVDAMLGNREIYKEIESLFDGGKCTGVKPYLSEHVCDELSLSERQDSFYFPAARFASHNALPTTYEDGFVNILFGEHARYISEEELKNGSIIDITAAKVLTERGIDVGIDTFAENETYKQTGFTDLPQEYFIDEDVYVRLWHGVTPCNVVLKEGSRLLTEYVYGQKRRLPGDFEYENSRGMRFRVMTFDANDAKHSRDWLSTYAKRRSLVQSVKRLGRALDVSLGGNYPNLYLMTKEKEGTLRIGAWNLFDDKIENMRLKLNDVPAEVRFFNCNGHVEGDEIVLDSTLYPYEFAGFEIVK